MPLIVLTGYPCCGKTTFAELLAFKLAKGAVSGSEEVPVNAELALKTKYFSDAGVFIVNEESESIKKCEAYMFSSQEKNTRGALKSAVGHRVNASSVVICDSLNYIKGFRYELHCLSKTFRTPYCVVWVESDESLALQWNAQRSSDNKYEEATIVDLKRRYEAPNDKNRWDCPLFRVNMTPFKEKLLEENVDQASLAPQSSETTESTSTPKKSSWKPKSKSASSKSDDRVSIISTSKDSSLEPAQLHGTLSFSGSYVAHKATSHYETPEQVIDRIIEYLSNADKPVPNASTMPIFHGAADSLYELDHVSKKIMDMIVSHQNVSSDGTPIILAEYDRSLALHRRVAIPELQRHRRQFIKVNSTHPPQTSQAIGEAFIDFLALQI